MSGQERRNGVSETSKVETPPEIDVARLHSLPSEQQDLHLLNFVSELIGHIRKLDAQTLDGQQPAIKKQLVVLLNLSSPIPSRPIRNTLGLIYAETFGPCSRTLLSEAISELLDIINAPKAEKDTRNKHAAVVCLRHLVQSTADNAPSQSGPIITGLLKLTKQAQNDAGLRAAALRALGDVADALGNFIDEFLARDIWKLARSAASNDKSLLCQTAACYCLKCLITATSHFDTASDYDAFKSTAWKVLESSSTRVRHAAASVLASAFVKFFAEGSTPESARKERKITSKTSGIGTSKIEAENDHDAASAGSHRQQLPELSLSIEQILQTLGAYFTKSSTSYRARAGLAVCYKYTLRRLPEEVVEGNYSVIASHLYNEVLSHPLITHNRYRLLFTRRVVKFVLDATVGNRLLKESAQVNAVQWLLNSVLSSPSSTTSESHPTTQQATIAALSSLSSLMMFLGPATNLLADDIRETLMRLLTSSSFTVRIHVSRCFRSLALACPQQLLVCANTCIGMLEANIPTLSESSVQRRRSAGYANALAALVAASRSRPLYGSVQIFSQMLAIATSLFKISSVSELRVSATQIEIAWTLIGGLMPLGPNFVKVHLSQLLLLWRNALPPPLVPENSQKTGLLETSFLAHVRGCALAAMLVFLEYNESLVTTDGSRRLASMLQNTIAFYESAPTFSQNDQTSDHLIPGLQLSDLMLTVRCRVLQCFTRLSYLSNLENALALSQSNLMSLAISAFSEPEKPPNQDLEASMASSASNFESLWHLADNWGFGSNRLVDGYDIKITGSKDKKMPIAKLPFSADEEDINSLLRSPTCKALEYDPISVYLESSESAIDGADPPATQTVNAAISLFASVLPLQPPKVQESSLEQLALLQSRPYSREPGRKAALQLNIATAILLALTVANRETNFSSGKLAASSVEKGMAAIVQEFIIHEDPFFRNIGVESIAQMCNLCGSSFTNLHVRQLIAMVIAKRDPETRAGCAMALGRIYRQVGSMAAGFHLQTIVGVLMSLCNDTHPLVHFWALYGLNQVTEAAGLNFSGYLASTLGMLAQLFSKDTHTEEDMSLATSNLEFESSTTFLVTSCIDSLIDVLGPDLQHMNRERRLIERLIDYFCREESVHLVAQGSLCSGHLAIFLPDEIDLRDYVEEIRRGLGSDEERVRHVAVDNLNDLVKRDASKTFSMAGVRLENALWLTLDKHPGHAGIQNVIQNWLYQTWQHDTGAWIQRCQDILTKTQPRPESSVLGVGPASAHAPLNLQDEEVTGFAVAAITEQGERRDGEQDSPELLKWQTRSFAMSCLSQLISLISDTTSPDQITAGEITLQGRISDIVRMAFSASTAHAVRLRNLGLRILDQILKLFGKTPDPDFTEASLLEQYQAQISSALTPAFASDSSPELASEAISVCATFVGAGIVTNIERMGRIFKLLVTGLENVTDSSTSFSIGDLKIASPNAQTMLRLALLSAWAQLQVSSREQHYLEALVRPYQTKLTPLWLQTLDDYAKLRFEPEISNSPTGSGHSQNLDETYSAFNRETLLHFYSNTWLNIIEAIAVLIDQGNAVILDALGVQGSDFTKHLAAQGQSMEPAVRLPKEPATFFFPLYGLTFEALITRKSRQVPQTYRLLQVVQKLLLPVISGGAIYQDAVFDESLELLNRLALTEGLTLQKALLDMSSRLAIDLRTVTRVVNSQTDLSTEIEQLGELTRVIFLVTTSLVPITVGPSSSPRRAPGDEAVAVVEVALNVAIDVAEIYPAVIKADLFSCLANVFCSIITTDVCQTNLTPQAFPVFKRFVQSVTSAGDIPRATELVQSCLRQVLSLFTSVQQDGDEYATLCGKNAMLAATILLTAGGPTLAMTDPIVHPILDQISDRLYNTPLATRAATCIRSLLLSKPKSPCGEAVFRHLLPRMLHFITADSDRHHDEARISLTHTLITAIKMVPATSKPALSSLIVPALLARHRLDSPPSQAETASQLLEIAKAGQSSFRDTLSGLERKDRALVEMILKSGPAQQGSGDGVASASGDDRPSIALKMDF